jgi:signal transduction histidine kinase
LMVNQKREQALIVAALERVIKDLRGIASNRLSPIGLDRGLAQALEAMVEKQRGLGIPVTFLVDTDYTEPKTLSSLARHELYFVAQEAVVNAVKHAEASQINVSLVRALNGVQVAVVDNGKGFDARGMLKGRETRGIGIMQARASRIGAKLVVESQLARGTAIRVEWRAAEGE